MNGTDGKHANRNLRDEQHANLWKPDAILSFNGGGLTPEAAKMTWSEIRESLAEQREGFLLSANLGEDRNA